VQHAADEKFNQQGLMEVFIQFSPTLGEQTIKAAADEQWRRLWLLS
jgi:hypothetical protein